MLSLAGVFSKSLIMSLAVSIQYTSTTDMDSICTYDYS